MAIYDARRSHDAELTARDYSDLLQKIQRPPPDGALWLVLAPRRYGKTWTLKELEHRLAGRACYLELRWPGDKKIWSAGRKVQPGGHWLLDEISGLIEASDKAKALQATQRFLSRCEKLRGARTNVVLALTPRELHQLQSADGNNGRISPKSILRLDPLTPKEIEKLSRTPEAHALLARVPSDWKRTPFLLELLFEVEERARNQGTPLDHSPLKAVLQASEKASHRYFQHVFWDALTDEHRDLLRAIARGEPVNALSCEPLLEAGLVGEPAKGPRWIADPVLAARLSTVRIHHLSDIHVGPKSARSIDAKEPGRISEAVDPGVVRESYLSHLEGLRAKGKAPHLLIISGDLTEHATREQCEEARRWLDRIPPLLEPHALLEDDPRRVLLVGGNHDVDWSQTRAGGEQARHQNFAEFFKDYAHPHLELSPASKERRELKPIEWPDLGISILLLGTSELGGEIERDKERHELRKELAKLPRPPSTQEQHKAEELALKAARIDPGLVHTQDLRRVETYGWNDKLPVRLAVMHHPPSPLPSTEVARYSGLLNAGAVKQVLMEKGFCLVLCGHAHKGWFAEERWHKHSGERTLRIAAAPSLGSYEIAENNGFNLVEIFRDRAQNSSPHYELRVRRFVRKGDHEWEEHADKLGPFSP
jgi:3',5'-cyclic AMP phosphodiesterase CpdA